MAKDKTASELKAEYLELREKEIKGFTQELGVFLSDRNIELSATVTVSPGHEPNMVNIIVIDKL